MSLIDKKINKNIFYRNIQTLHNNIRSSQSYINKNDSLPTIPYPKNEKYNKKYERHNLNLVKSPTIKKSIKNVLLSPLKNSQTNINQINIKRQQEYITQIIIDNPPSPEEVTFLLENYLKKTKCVSNFRSFYDLNTMAFAFQEEKVALDFMQLLFQEKQVNPSYKYTSINISLSKKKNKAKFLEINQKIAKEVLQRLYYGFGYEKKEKPIKKVIGTVKFSIESPFFYKNQKKMKKNISEINSKEKIFFNKKLKIDNEDNKEGKPFMNNKKLKLNSLNNTYKPLSKVIIRNEDKSKWMCPLDFKIY